MALEEEIRVLYQDNHLLALYKPAGMLVQADRTGDLSLLEWAKEWIRQAYAKPGQAYLGLVHRLDRPVPGVVLFARTTKAAQRLSQQFRTHQVGKRYLAVINGRLDPAQGTSRLYVARTRKRTVITSPHDPAGKRAELHYRTIEHKSRLSLVEVTLRTGRHHQIRAQLAALGHPIVGDTRYGSPVHAPQGMIALLAKRLSCRHPTRRMEITVEAPIPKMWPWPPI
jgi:23S rRNA pseudouridine1911/1915/1917 synthase